MNNNDFLMLAPIGQLVVEALASKFTEDAVNNLPDDLRDELRTKVIEAVRTSIRDSNTRYYVSNELNKIASAVAAEELNKRRDEIRGVVGPEIDRMMREYAKGAAAATVERAKAEMDAVFLKAAQTALREMEKK